MAPPSVSSPPFHLGRTNRRGRRRMRSANQNNQQHTQLPCSQELICMLPQKVKEDYVGEIMGQSGTNRLIIFQLRIRTRVSRRACECAQWQVFMPRKSYRNKKTMKKTGVGASGIATDRATCSWLSIQPTNDLPGQFYVCLEEN